MDYEITYRSERDNRKARNNKKRASLHHLATASAEVSLNKLPLAAEYGAISAQLHQEESSLFQCSQRGIWHGNLDEFGRTYQMKAKTLVDQVFLARKFVHEAGMGSKSRDSYGFEQELDARIARKIKSSQRALATNEATLRSILAAKLAKHEGLKPGLSERKASLISSQNESSSRSGDKIVFLKPVNKRIELVTCRCSSLVSKTLKGRGSSFSLGKVKKKLRGDFEGNTRESPIFARNDAPQRLLGSRSSSVAGIRDAKTPSIIAAKKEDPSWRNLKLNQGCVSNVTPAAGEETAISGGKKQDLDMISEAKWQLSFRSKKNRQFQETFLDRRSSKALQKIIFSPEYDFWPLSPRREKHYCTADSPKMQCSPCSIPGMNIYSHTQQRYCAFGANTEVSSRGGLSKCNESDKRENASSEAWRHDGMMHDSDHSARENVNAHGKMKNNSLTRIRQPGRIESLDSLSENEESTCRTDDASSTSSSIHQLQLCDGITESNEYQSPISVLEPFPAETAVTTLCISPEKGEQKMQPLHLDFEECSLNPSPENRPKTKAFCVQEHFNLPEYVHTVLQASCLNWNILSKIEPPPEEILQDSLFDEVDYLPDHCYFDPKLLFDHINEVLMEIYKSHSKSTAKIEFLKSKVLTTSLAAAVIDQIMTEADFYLLPRTDKRSLDELVSEDVKKSVSWHDIRLDTEFVVVDISEDVLKESVLEMLLEFLTR